MMTAVASKLTVADLSAVRVDPNCASALSGGDIYAGYLDQTVHAMTRARKSVLFARIGMGKTKMASSAATLLAAGDKVTVVGSAVSRTMLSTELRDAGYEYPVNVLTPQKLQRDLRPLANPGVLMVDLSALLRQGSAHSVRGAVAEVAANVDRVVMFGYPGPPELGYLKLLAARTDDITVVDAS